MKSNPTSSLSLACAFFTACCLPAAAQNFTGAVDDTYANGSNWSSDVTPDLSTGAHAVIGINANVTYDGDLLGDMIISNGGELELSAGSFTQTTGINYFNIGRQGNGAGTGNGTFLIDGGTFNQGTVSSSPFNIEGTGNVFQITSGAANFSSSFNVNTTGFTYLQQGGTVTVGGNEFDFNSTGYTLSGGMLITKLITGVNSPGLAQFDITGGVLNLTGTTTDHGIYAGGPTQFINFTLGSTGSIEWTGGVTTTTDVQNFITDGKIEYNGAPTSDLSLFSITSSGGITTLSLDSVPEPSTYALLLGGLLGLIVLQRRSRRQA